MTAVAKRVTKVRSSDSDFSATNVMTAPHVHEFYLAILEYSQQWKEGRIQLPEYWTQAFADIKEAKEAEASLVELARNPLGTSEGLQAEQYGESQVPSDKAWDN